METRIQTTRGALDLFIARRFHQRLLGLIVGPPRGLLFFDTPWIHTIGMRYAIDVWFMAGDFTILSHFRNVRPFCQVRCADASVTLEIPSAWSVDLDTDRVKFTYEGKIVSSSRMFKQG